MSKRPFPQLQPIYDVAREWVNSALRSDGSLLTPGRPIWSLANVETLYERTHGNPQEAAGDFEAKLRHQLSGAAPDVYQLAAEQLIVYCLVSTKGAIGAKRKRAMIVEVLEWGGLPVELPPLVEASFAEGLVNPGTAYNTKKPMQLWFLLDFVRALKKVSSAEREAVLTQPARLRELLFSLEVQASQSMREALLHLVQPDFFEAITSRADKKQLVKSFEHLVQNKSGNVDEQIADIRGALAAAHGPALDSGQWQCFRPAVPARVKSGLPMKFFPLGSPRSSATGDAIEMHD